MTITSKNPMEDISKARPQLKTSSVKQYVANLNKLKKLNLSLNTLQGSLPEEISKIESLEYLYLYSNDFIGIMPPAISQLPNLRRVRTYATNIQTNTTHTLAIID